MTQPIATPETGADAGGAGEGPQFPFPAALVEEMLRMFMRAARAQQLYLPNNPIYQGAIEGVRNAFAAIWQHTDELELRFGENDIKWHGKVVQHETVKSADSLSWTFFKDGIRSLQFLKGFEQEELLRLFEILQRIRRAAPDEDDLLTMLWQADFAHLRYRYVDIGAEPTTDLGGESKEEESSQPSADEVRSRARGGGSPASAIVNLAEFDASLYFLDEKELDYLRQEVNREYESDLRRNVLAILFDIYETQTAPAVREELSDLLENMLLLMLASGQLRTVAFLLAESQVVMQRAQAITQEQRQRLGRLPERMSAPEPMGQLLQGLDEAADLPPQSELNELFAQLHPLALGTIFQWLTRIQNARIKPLVEQAADRLAGAHTAELVKLIQVKDDAVALEAMRRAGAMKSPAAVAPLAKVLVDGNVTIRQHAVKALTEIGSAGALQALERSIEDADRDVRIAAVRTLGAKAYRGVFTRLDAVVKGTKLREADLTEKMAFFEAFGAMCGDAGVPFLDSLLNSKGVFGKREDSELRACAAIALGRVGTRKAIESLQRSSSEKDVVVRNAVTRALRAGSA